MAYGRICICFLVVVAALGYYANGDMSMDDICNKHKNAGRCDRPAIKKQCGKICGGGDEQTQAPEPTQAPEKPTTKSQNPTTKNSNSNTDKPSGGGGGKKCDKRSPCVGMDQANAAFRKRCEATNGALKETCYDHCRYDQDTNSMKKAFLGGPCPLSQLRVFLTAASGGRDNAACCDDQGVTGQKKTAVCGCFCNPTGPVWPQKGETAKYAPCVSVLEGIMKCHYYAEGAE